LAQSDPVFAGGTSRGAFGFDVGLIAAPWEPVSFGLSLRNVNRPDVGLVSEDRVPRELRAGVAVALAGLGLRATGELAVRGGPGNGPWSNVVPSIGLEKLLAPNVAFRVGGGPTSLNAGVGVGVGNLTFDYSVSWSPQLGASNYGTHLIGIRFRFGPGALLFGARAADSQARGPAVFRQAAAPAPAASGAVTRVSSAPGADSPPSTVAAPAAAGVPPALAGSPTARRPARGPDDAGGYP